MLFSFCLKLNVHLHLSKFKVWFFLTSQHAVRDTLLEMVEVAFTPQNNYSLNQRGKGVFLMIRLQGDM